ncbi:EAL domain-containing protein [Synechococcus sp. Nb3U1]|uniref:putative bifunctional diguanylate cyclase/phosphodiesterase n=1 Tax=Synechococcus sp. Nb3U1 TaxID=1914529 RepID=UPI001F343788|nr:EAL domain-containing protein [Synechococcus sp. Nb3U1]MCF2970496.1 EAL domain-containing protein [Synechococcus sp. Nb3U1]
MLQPPLEPSAELPKLSEATTDEVQSHLATLWGTLRLIHQGRLNLHSPKGRQLLEAGIQNALHLLSLLRGPSVPEGISCQAVLSQSLDSEIKLALGRGQLLLQYQPFFRLDSGELVGCEALLRWQHPERGWIPPSEFIPVAECSDLIHEMGIWVLKTACQQMVQWQKQLGRPLQLSVNLSARQLDQPDLRAQISRVLLETGFPARHLSLELTESSAVQNYDKASQQLLHLQRLGIQIGLDDFGTGYSSLSCLDNLPLNFLKIDQSFVAKERWDTLQLILLLAQQLDLAVVAEGIETPEQLEHLQNIGCPMGQGYHLSFPLTPEQVQSWLPTVPVAAACF